MNDEYNILVEFLIVRVLEVNNPESLDNYYDNIFPKIIDNFKNVSSVTPIFILQIHIKNFY